jgi:hypothetical protein
MYVEGGNGSGGGGRPERRKGTRLAPELDRRLAGDEPLDKAIEWWHDEWRGATRMHIAFAFGNEAIVDGFQPVNFSDNEFAVFMIATLSGCGVDDRAAQLHWLWPMAGLDAAKMTDATYAREAMGKYIDQLIAARTELRRSRN